MLNRNAARHLALVVGVLLCFFVYMGYRFRGSASSPAQSTATEIASLPMTEPSSSTSLMTMGDNVAEQSSPLRPPISVPSGPETARSGGEFIPDISDLLQSESNTGGSELPDFFSQSSTPVPSGSLEESELGSITGLVPADENAGMEVPSFDSESLPASFGELLASESAEPAGSGSSGSSGAAGLRPPMESSPSQLTPPADFGAAPSSFSAAQDDIPPAFFGEPPAASTPPPAFTPPAASTRSTQTGEIPRRADPVAAPLPAQRDIPPAASMPRPGVDDTLTPSESLRIYVIRPGDTLSRIAARELGSISLADNIYLLNRDVISDPDHLLVGVRIRLPVRESLPPMAGAPRPTGALNGTTPPSGPATTRLHRVMPGDTLSSISMQYYGTSASWRSLHQANAALLPNPNQLTVGMELVIPPFASLK